jgi:hypothetical protein
MRTAYISGPMRRVPEYNYPAFFAAEKALQDAGWEVLNPARISEEKHPGFVSDGSPVHSRLFAAQDLAVIIWKLRAERGDAVVTLPGWEQSRGACGEVAVGRWVRLPILTLEEALADRS